MPKKPRTFQRPLGERRFVLSNPNFEYWLLLNFEDGKGIANSQECLTRLKRHLPNYKKDIDGKKITLELITKAISRAKQRDTNRSNVRNTSFSRYPKNLPDHVQSSFINISSRPAK